MHRDRDLQPPRRHPRRSLRAIGLALVLLVLAASRAAAQDLFLYKPIDPRATARDWSAEAPALPAEVHRALAAYETNPGMTTAIEVLKHYKTFSGLDLDTRGTILALDPVLFQTLDAAKYELVMQTQKRLHTSGNEIGHAMRVGSTGARHMAWLAWVADGQPMDRMPDLDPAKQFQSDDDVTNHPPRGRYTFQAAEDLNGANAARAFQDVSRELFGNEMHPETAMIEFLSPTKAYSILDNEGITEEGKPALATFLHEWVASNPEKYNGLFAVEQLDRWAYEKGYITQNVLDPGGSTQEYRNVYAAHNEGRPAPTPENAADLFGWMSNQTRQAFGTHQGELKYLKKYTERMIAAWQKVLDETPVAASDDTPALRAFRSMLAEYTFDDPDELPRLLDNHSEAGLKDIHRQLIEASHEWHTQLLTRRLKEQIQANHVVDEAGNRRITRDFRSMVNADPALRQATAGLAVAYANLDREARNRLDRSLEEKIAVAEADAAGGDVYAGEVARYLHEARRTANQAAVRGLQNTQAFTRMREQLGASLEQHLRTVEASSLDSYLLKVAEGRFTRGELHYIWDDDAFGFVQRQLTPQDVERELTTIRNITEGLGWSDRRYAQEVKSYFESEPSTAVQLLMTWHRLTGPEALRPIRVQYTDANGQEVVRVLEPTRWGNRMSLALVTFKSAIKGAQAVNQIVGYAQGGRQLYDNLRAIYYVPGAGADPEELAKRHAQVVATAIGFHDLGEWFGQKAILGSYSGTLGALATLSGESFQAEGTSTALIQAIATDLVGAYLPQVAMALFVYNTGTSLWKEWTLRSARSDVIDLLVENGDWTEHPDGLTPPTLNGFYWYDGGSPPRLDNEIARLARRMPGPFRDGITLRESRRKVNPREALLEIGYSANYFTADHVNQATVSAARNITFERSGWLTGDPYDPRGWTEDWLQSSAGLSVAGVHEDSRTMPDRPDVRLVAADPGSWASGTGGTWPAHFNASGKKVLGYLVAHYWTRRQVLVEDVILKKLIEEAALKKQKELLVARDASTFLDELERLEKRMIELDRKVWAEVALSADPFAGPGYDADTDIPITEGYRNETADRRRNVERIVEWLGSDSPDPNGPVLVTTDAGSFFGADASAAGSGDLEALADQLEAIARTEMSAILDVVTETEKQYGDVLGRLAGTQKLTGEDGLDIRRYHVALTGERGSDPGVAEAWDGEYREEIARVSSDVGTRLYAAGMELPALNSGFATVDDVWAGAEEALFAATGRGGWLEMARAHPYFPYLLRLRFQIHKLRNMQGREADMPADEVVTAARSMVQRREPVTVAAGAVGTPDDRRLIIASMIDLMEGEYQQLLAGLLDLVVPSLTLAASPPVDLFTDVVGGVSLDLSDARDFIQQLQVSDLVQRIRWTLFDVDGSVSAQAVGDATEWSAFPLASGPNVLRVEALGGNDLVLGTAADTFDVAQAEFRGTIEVVGDVPPDTDVWMELDGGFSWPGVQAGPFSHPIDRIPEGYPERLGLELGRPSTNRPRVRVNVGSTFPASVRVTGSPAIPVTATPGLLEPDEALVVNFGTGVLVTVEVQDAASYPVRDADVTVEAGSATVASTPDDPRPLILPIAAGDLVTARARRDRPAPAVDGASESVTWDGVGQVGPTLTVQLPFFDVGHLRVSGTVVPAVGSDLRVIGGSVTGNATNGAGIADGGDFQFDNEAALLVTDGLALEVDPIVEEDWLVRTVAVQPIRADLQPGFERRLDPIEIERYEVFVEPVPVAVTDWTGTPLGHDQVAVAVGGDPAGGTGTDFAGAWTFRKRGEVVDVTASMALPDGVPAEGSASLSIDDVGDHRQPRVTAPLEIRLPAYAAGAVTFSATVLTADVPADVLVPDRAQVVLDGAPGQGVDVGTAFSVPSGGPVGVGRDIRLVATAESGGVRFRGEATAVVDGSGTVVDFGDVVMRPAVAVADADAEDAGEEGEGGGRAAGVGAGGAAGAGAGGGEAGDAGSGGGAGSGGSGSTGPSADELAPLTSGWEARRDAARAACDYAGAADAQDKVVEVAEAWVAGAFPTGPPVEVQTLIDQLRSEAATLRRAAESQKQAELLLATAEAQGAAGQADQALTTLEEANGLPSLPMCTGERLAAAHDALVDEVTRLVEQARSAAAVCDYVHAAEIGEQIRAAAGDTEWVRTELPRIEELARAQEAAHTFFEQAAREKARGNVEAAGMLAEQALQDAPSCDRQAIEGFLASLGAGEAGGPGGVGPGGGPPSVPVTRTVLLLIDTSGSMGNEGKIDAAKAAAATTVRAMGPNVEVGLMTYDGGCSGGWRVNQPFTQEREPLLRAIAALSPGGGTPMSPAVIAATRYMEREGRSVAGQMLVLSDGQDSCTEVGARAAGNAVRQSSMHIKLDGVGLGLAEGSQAESDLADLVGTAGTGTTFSASAGSAGELIRAFRRAFLADQVKPADPVVDGPGGVRLAELYETARRHLEQNDVRSARLAYEQAVREEPGAPSAHYNLSLAYEAEGQPLSAIRHAREYLRLAPRAPDAAAVRERVAMLEEEQRENPTAIFDPGQCSDLYGWARAEAGRVGDADQRALAFSVMTSAQRGDCEAARAAYQRYLSIYGG